VTERVKVEAKLRDQAKQRDMFLAMLSHELRNPLSAVLTASHLLLDQRVSPAIHPRAIATIQRQASMIASLLDDLLDVTRISLGKIELSLSIFNLVDLIESIRETTAPEIASHQSTLYFEVLEPELWVEADSARLIQVHVNLIHNAAKYSPPGSPIYVSMRGENGYAVVSVRDEGSGIPADFLPRIFEPFVQSDETLDRSEGGLGVGLTLVKSLVDLHRGTIEAFSEGRDSGSTFVLRIPLINVRPPTRDAASKNLAVNDSAIASSSDGLRHSNPSAKRIVLVEDIDDNREMLQSILELDGHEVFTAMDGEAGCEAILTQIPDIALIDIGLPGMDGYEVARRVRRNSNCENVRLVALTGYGQSSDIANALAAGFDAHLVKPVDPHSLAAILESPSVPSISN
jgi:two-component system CheB/CheR fusion protein